ncbi:hypothetical protein L3X38_030280 [Prunus dulcis]|uniref:Uncharacterized protein n=1 Tax=Prunus dulcis TaxID=3755 RepID=A0AAD4V9Y0_PRUDU|nr:hypothetical protein L3X38_030280 [Prunus dulcis]
MRGLLGAHWLRILRNSEVKRVEGWSNPRMGDHPGKLFQCSAAQEQTREGPVVGAKADNIVVGGVGPGPLRHSEPMRGLLGAHWLRILRNSEVKRVEGWSNPRMGDHPGKLFPGKLFRELPETKPCGLVRT